MTVIEPDPVLEENPIANNGNVEGSVEEEERLLDGGFVVLGSNAFGHSFRDYEKESERRATVEEFYRVNHIYQTYAI